jgi:hypothetical protein
MLIQFVTDFRGALTNEQFYAAGQIVNLDTGPNLIAEGVAVGVAPDPDPEDAPEPELKPKRGAK